MSTADHPLPTPRTKPLRRDLAVLALSLGSFACGGGGGSSDGPSELGAFGQKGEVLAIDPSSATARVDAAGAPGYEVFSLARDSVDDVFYGVDQERQLLLRIDALGNVTRVGKLTEPVGSLVFDPDAGELVGVRNGAKFQPSNIVRVDPTTAEVTVGATTSTVFHIAFDRALGRLLAVAVGSNSMQTNTVVAIDPVTGASTPEFTAANVGQATGLAFDPVTRTLLVAMSGDPGGVVEYDLTGSALGLKVYPRRLADVQLDTDTGRRFGLNGGGELSELSSQGGSSSGAATPIVTLRRELYGLTFDPVDGRFFAIDAPNHEVVKVTPSTGAIARVVRVALRAGLHRDMRTLAFDPTRGRLYTVDRNHAELLSVDPATGEAVRVNVGLGDDTVLTMDTTSGRLLGYDQDVEVLVEIDVDLEQSFLLDNGIGLTKVEDLAWDPLTQRLVAVHETAGGAGEPKLSSIEPVGTASPLPHTDLPRGLTAIGRDDHTGRFHAFGASQPRLELELDLAGGSSFFQRVRSVDGAWATPLRAALTVPSLGVSFAVDGDRLYAYDPIWRTMLLKGSTPSGVLADDLLFDPATGYLGLRDGSQVTWVDPEVPFASKGTTGAPTSPTMRLTTGATGRVFGIDSGVLFEVGLGSPATSLALTPLARPDFDVESIATSGSAVFAIGTDAAAGTRLLVRFDTLTGEWTDQGQVDDAATTVFVR